MTATLRPDLIERTLSSHTKYLFKECICKARLIINIDFAGEENLKLQTAKFIRIIELLDNYPFRAVTFRPGNDPDFARAFFWCHDNTTSDYVFNLEEDWEMKYPIDFFEMFRMMERDTTIAHLRLSAFVSEEGTCKNWNKFTYWNGYFFEVTPAERGIIGWCGHPSLNKRSFLSDVLRYCDRTKNPEKQIKAKRHPHPINMLISSHRFGVFTPQRHPKVVEDIGRSWMVNHGYEKEGNKAFFTQWRKVSKNER